METTSNTIVRVNGYPPAERWQTLGPPDVRFFAYATAYDSDRAIVIGHRCDGIDELAGRERHPLWRRVADAFPAGAYRGQGVEASLSVGAPPGPGFPVPPLQCLPDSRSPGRDR